MILPSKISDLYQSYSMWVCCCSLPIIIYFIQEIYGRIVNLSGAATLAGQ